MADTKVVDQIYSDPIRSRGEGRGGKKMKMELFCPTKPQCHPTHTPHHAHSRADTSSLPRTYLFLFHPSHTALHAHTYTRAYTYTYTYTPIMIPPSMDVPTPRGRPLQPMRTNICAYPPSHTLTYTRTLYTYTHTHPPGPLGHFGLSRARVKSARLRRDSAPTPPFFSSS